MVSLVTVEDISEPEEMKGPKHLAGSLKQENEIRMQFAANNFVTPRLDEETADLQTRLNPAADTSEPRLNSSKKHLSIPFNRATDALADEEDGSMEKIFEGNLKNFAARRTSSRINMLLFEEDSQQIKQEMERQKKEQQRIHMEQRISLKFSVGAQGARRSTKHRLAMQPSTARNLHSGSLLRKTGNGAHEESFGTALHFPSYYCGQLRTSQSLVESLDEFQSERNNTTKTMADCSGFGHENKLARGDFTAKADLYRPVLTASAEHSYALEAKLRVDTVLSSKDPEAEAHLAINSPILAQVKI